MPVVVEVVGAGLAGLAAAGSGDVAALKRLLAAERYVLADGARFRRPGTGAGALPRNPVPGGAHRRDRHR